ncbi:putative secondary metabolism biosynthetic enzyme [Botryosphaeria dothidea]
MSDPDAPVKAGLFTQRYFRDVYPAVDPRSTELSQAGKVAIITGAGRGIGKGIALAFARAGAQGIVLVSRSQKNADAVRDSIKAENPSLEVLALAADISDEQAVEDLDVDVVGKVLPAKWWTDFEVNLKGTFLVTAGFIRAFGAQDRTIINVASDTGLLVPRFSGYFTSKIAVTRLTEFLAAESPENSVYSINPGLVATDSLLDEFKHFAKDTPELAGGVCVYLAAKRPAYLNGRHFSVNWDVLELESRKDEIVSGDKLKLKLST